VLVLAWACGYVRFMHIANACAVCGVSWTADEQSAMRCIACGAPNPAFALHDEYCPQAISLEISCLCPLLAAVRDDERQRSSARIRSLREQMLEIYEQNPHTAEIEQGRGELRGMRAAEMLVKGTWLRRSR